MDEQAHPGDRRVERHRPCDGGRLRAPRGTRAAAGAQRRAAGGGRGGHPQGRRRGGELRHRSRRHGARVPPLAEPIIGEHGVPDVVVNNAGAGQWKPFVETSADEARAMMELPYCGGLRRHPRLPAGDAETRQRAGRFRHLAGVVHGVAECLGLYRRPLRPRAGWREALRAGSAAHGDRRDAGDARRWSPAPIGSTIPAAAASCRPGCRWRCPN